MQPNGTAEAPPAIGFWSDRVGPAGAAEEGCDVVRKQVRHGWMRTLYPGQEATCGLAMAYPGTFGASTGKARSVYVAIGRATMGMAVYTDSRAAVTDALFIRDGARIGVIDGRHGAAFGAGGRQPRIR